MILIHIITCTIIIIIGIILLTIGAYLHELQELEE